MTEVLYYSGWIGGLFIGFYGLFQLVTTGHLLGVSTGFGNVCGVVSKASFFHTGKYTNLFNWRLWFIIGIPVGGLIAALTSPGAITPSFSMGEFYDAVFTTKLYIKGPLLILGGTLIGLGSRMAGGCTSGHSISGLGLLNWPSFVASAGFFAGGTIVVQILDYLLDWR